MGLLIDFRALLLDNPTNVNERTYSDAQLTAALEFALREINIYSETWTWTIVTLDAAMASPSVEINQAYNLAIMRAHIAIVEGSSGSHDDFVKISTQDTMIDPGDAGTRLSKMLTVLNANYDRALQKWIGIDRGTYGHTAPIEEF